MHVWSAFITTISKPRRSGPVTTFGIGCGVPGPVTLTAPPELFFLTRTAQTVESVVVNDAGKVSSLSSTTSSDVYIKISI